MDKNESFDNSFYKGLQALSTSSFPKKCMACGRTYRTVEEYIDGTQSIRNLSGLKASLDEDDRPIVELFRNCVCGSTLMDTFNNRRDLSEAGIRRRKKFGELVEKLVNAGYSHESARAELLKIMRGEDSILLKKDHK
jgi:hypothetical protein